MGILKFLWIFGVLSLAPLLASPYQDGVRFLEANRYQNAVDAFKQAIKDGERSGDARFQLGQVLLRSQEYEAALQNFYKALEEGSRLDGIGEALQKVLVELERNLTPNQIDALHTEALKRELYTPPSVYHRLLKLRSQERFKESAQLMQTAMKSPIYEVGQRHLKTYLGNAHFLASAAYSNLKNTSKALEQARLALQHDPNLEPARQAFERLSSQVRKRYRHQSDLAKQAFSRSEYPQAIKHWQKALEIKPRESEAKQGLEQARMAKASLQAEQRGKKLLQEGQLEKAIQELSFAVNAYSDNFAARNLLSDARQKLLARMDLKEQRQEEAKHKEQTFLKTMTQASNAFKHRRYQEAVNLYRKALQADPSSEEAQNGLAESEAKLKLDLRLQQAADLISERSYQKALAILRELESSGMEGSRLEELKAPCLFSLGKYAELKELSEKIVAYQPRNVEHLYYIAIASQKLHAQGKMENGLEVYETMLNRISQEDPEYIDVQNRLNSILWKRLTPIIAIGLILLLLALVMVWHFKTKDARRKHKFLNACENALKASDYHELKSLYDEYLAIELNARETMRLLPTFALALVECAEYDEAQKVCSKVLGAMPEHRQTRVQNARAMVGKGILPQNSIKHFQELLNSEYKTEENTLFCGEKIVEQELRGEDAVEILRHYLKLEPTQTKARQMLLDMTYRDQRIDPQVVALMQQEIEHNPKDVRFRLKLAEHFLEKKDTEECIRLCEEIINLDVTDKRLHKLLLNAYELQNDLNSLQPLYDSLLQTYPNSIVIQEAAAQLKIKTASKTP